MRSGRVSEGASFWEGGGELGKGLKKGVFYETHVEWKILTTVGTAPQNNRKEISSQLCGSPAREPPLRACVGVALGAGAFGIISWHAGEIPAPTGWVPPGVCDSQSQTTVAAFRPWRGLPALNPHPLTASDSMGQTFGNSTAAAYFFAIHPDCKQTLKSDYGKTVAAALLSLLPSP